MLTSLAFIFLAGLAMAAFCQMLKLPRIIGMLACGIILGPHVLDLLDPSILSKTATQSSIPSFYNQYFFTIYQETTWIELASIHFYIIQIFPVYLCFRKIPPISF